MFSEFKSCSSESVWWLCVLCCISRVQMGVVEFSWSGAHRLSAALLHRSGSSLQTDGPQTTARLPLGHSGTWRTSETVLKSALNAARRTRNTPNTTTIFWLSVSIFPFSLSGCGDVWAHVYHRSIFLNKYYLHYLNVLIWQNNSNILTYSSHNNSSEVILV